MTSALTVVFCGLLALTGFTDAIAVGAAVLLGQLLMATLPAPGAGDGVGRAARPFVPVVIGSVVATGLMLRPETLVGADGTTAVEEASATAGFQIGIGPGVAVALLAALFMQMTRKDGRPMLVPSLAYVVTTAVFAVCFAVWVTVPSLSAGEAVVAAAAAGGAAASLIWWLPGPRVLLGFGAVVAGAVGGGVFGHLVDDGVDADFGAVLGLTVGVMVVVGRAAAAAWTPDPRARLGFEAMLPLALAGPLVYLVGQFYVL